MASKKYLPVSQHTSYSVMSSLSYSRYVVIAFLPIVAITYSFAVAELEESLQTFNVNNYDVTTFLSNGRVKSVELEQEFSSIILTLETSTTDNGELMIPLPRALIDSRYCASTDDEFIVLINGEEVEFDETGTTFTERILKIPVPAGAEEIEIIGTTVIGMQESDYPVSCYNLIVPRSGTSNFDENDAGTSGNKESKSEEPSNPLIGLALMAILYGIIYLLGRIFKSKRKAQRKQKGEFYSCSFLGAFQNDSFNGMPRKTIKKLYKLETYEFPAGFGDKLKQKFPFNRMPDQDINACVTEFKKFMVLLLINHGSDRKIALDNEIIKQIWLTYLLFTREYYDFCHMLVGEYIHYPLNLSGRSSAQDPIQNFYEDYRKYFGELSPVWKYKIKESILQEATSNNSDMTMKLELITETWSRGTNGTV